MFYLKKSRNYIFVQIFLLSIFVSMNAQGKEVEVVLSEDTVSISNGLLGFDFNLKNGTYAGKDFKGQRKVFTGARFSIDAGQWKLPKYSYMWFEKFVSDYLGKGKTLNIKHVPSEGYHLIRNLKITLYENQPFAVKELGGIPFTYFQCSLPSNDFAVAHPEWMLNNDISLLHAEHRHHMPYVKYDYTDPGFQEYTLNMWKRLRSEGMQGIKFDYPESAWITDGGFEDKNYTTTSAYRKLFELCRQCLGPDAFIHERNLGEYGTPRLDVTAGIVDLQRVWWDSSHFEPEMAFRMGLRWYKNRVVFNYYPDGKSLYDPKTKEPLPEIVRRTLLTQIGLLSGRLELATSFGSMTEQMKHDLTRLYPVLREPKSFRPVDMLQSKKHPEVYVYNIDSAWSQVILCNNEKEEKFISAPLSGVQYETGSLGMKQDKSYYVYDFWNNSLVGIFRGKEKLNLKLDEYQSLVYSVHEVKERPQFISTNRHMMQGYAELDDVHWDEKENVYLGKADVIGGETMEIVIASNGYHNPKAKVSTGSVKVESTTNGLLLLKIDCKTNKSVKWSLSF